MFLLDKIWDKLCQIESKVDDNTKNIKTVSDHLMNHLSHVDKRTNVKLTILGITTATIVGLLAIFK